MKAVFKATIEFPGAMFVVRKEYHFDSAKERETFLARVADQFGAQVIKRSIDSVMNAEEAIMNMEEELRAQENWATGTLHR